MLGLIRKELLKLPSIKKLVADYRWRQKKEAHRKHWAHLMNIGNTVHTKDKPMVVDYLDGRMIGQRHVTPRVYNSEIWQELIRNQSDLNRDNDRSKLGTTENGSSAGESGVGPCSGD